MANHPVNRGGSIRLRMTTARTFFFLGTQAVTVLPWNFLVFLTLCAGHLTSLIGLTACFFALTLAVPCTGGPEGGWPVTVAVLVNGDASRAVSTC